MVDPVFRALKAAERMRHLGPPCAAWVCVGEYVTWVCLERKLGGMCVLNVLGRGLLMQEWEGVCSRVWSAWVKRETEPKRRRRKRRRGRRAFMECQEYLLHQGKLPAAAELISCVGTEQLLEVASGL